MANWKVVVYGVWPEDEQDGDYSCMNDDGAMASWVIEDRTEDEAFNEAAADVQAMGDEVADWTMEEIYAEQHRSGTNPEKA